MLLPGSRGESTIEVKKWNEESELTIPRAERPKDWKKLRSGKIIPQLFELVDFASINLFFRIICTIFILFVLCYAIYSIILSNFVLQYSFILY